jgi:flagellar hook-associated protein 1
MPGSFHGINSMSSALSALQRAIDVTGNNIANVNTKGYSRQRVDLKSAPEITFWSSGKQFVGSGVSISSLTRARDIFVDRNASRAMSDQGRLATKSTALTGIDSVYGEPSSDGISAAMGRLFDSFAALGANPSQSALRVEVRSAAAALADRIRAASSDLDSLEGQTKDIAAQTFDRIRELSAQIADLNSQIVSSDPESSPNGLLDERQRAIDELSGLIKIDTYPQSNGSVTVQAAGEILVDQVTSFELPDKFNPLSGSFDRLEAGRLRSGSLLGSIEALDSISAHRSQLDTLANEIRTAFNNLHQTGVNAEGGTGISLFDSSGTGARGLRLSSEVQASANAIASSVSGKPGDGSLAQALSALRDESRPALGGKSLRGFYSDMVNQGASDARQAIADLEGQDLLAQQIEAQRQAVSGVSLDEEFSNMIQLQRSYQAAARALNVFDQITEDLLGIIR